jgi:3-hydroxyacyl-CoA dehydrogenase/enoyl-CoA hydratase/3-hydroxybutyryl-CoA epimerase
VTEDSLAFHVDDHGTGWLILDAPGEKVNKLTLRSLEQLATLLQEAAAAAGIKGLVVASAKEGQFIAGADVKEIASVRDPEEARRLAARGQEVFQALADLPFPTAAAINGPCMGGGTELALACDLRVAADAETVSIALPEVRLGILPGFGGTQRLPRLVGLRRALDVILTGKNLDARRALRLGVVDRLVPADILWRETARLVRQAGATRRRRLPFLERLLQGNPLGRRIIVSAARKQVLQQTGGHYPAPPKALQSSANALRLPLPDGLAEEARLVGELVAGPVSKNLIWLFLASQAVKTGRHFQTTSGAEEAHPATVERVGLLGAGTMGGGLAWLLAKNGVTVRMKDIRMEALRSGLQAAATTFGHAVRRRRMTSQQMQRRMNRISTTLNYRGFATVDFVLEAVVEELEVKRKVLDEVEAAVSPDCIIASNTSSLPISSIAEGARRPHNVVGMHFFNPVHRMPLVEVIQGSATSEQAVATVYALACKLGKIPVVVQDRPGFLVNRLLAPYMHEASLLVAEGASVQAVDGALVRFGMPMGPLMLHDQVGLDIAAHVAGILGDAYGQRLGSAVALDPLLQAGRLGKKSGLGFYRHAGGKPAADPAAEALLRGAGSATSTPPGSDVMVERCLLRMMDEAARCLEEGVVRSAEDLDLALVFGTGFPPFRGGLLRYADTLGAAHVVQRLQTLAGQHGVRFEPCARLREMAEEGAAFRLPFPSAKT